MPAEKGTSSSRKEEGLNVKRGREAGKKPICNHAMRKRGRYVYLPRKNQSRVQSVVRSSLRGFQVEGGGEAFFTGWVV